MCEGTKGVCQKVLTRAKILSPSVGCFVAILRFVSIYAFFWKTLGKNSVFFGSKTVFLGQEVHYYMVYIAYFTELIWQICDYAQKRAFDAKIVNTRLTKIFIAIFAPDERLPSSATLVSCNAKC